MLSSFYVYSTPPLEYNLLWSSCHHPVKWFKCWCGIYIYMYINFNTYDFCFFVSENPECTACHLEVWLLLNEILMSSRVGSCFCVCHDYQQILNCCPFSYIREQDQMVHITYIFNIFISLSPSSVEYLVFLITIQGESHSPKHISSNIS